MKHVSCIDALLDGTDVLLDCIDALLVPASAKWTMYFSWVCP